ncbi:MAG: 4-phosphoerythronate dehydrogenase [Ignavibacteriales bacterium]
MNLIVDENIAFAKEAFSEFGNLTLLNGRYINNDQIKDAEVLIVRSITPVNAALLKNSKVKFVGTATIGTDHIDLQYLEDNNISFAEAKGCNADSVAEFVFTALLKIASEKNISLRGKSIGVVGIGHIGNRIVKLGRSLGMEILKNDPPLKRKNIGQNYSSLNEILKADIISLHVPLSTNGDDKTFHLLKENNLKEIKDEAIIINSSRGAVIDNTDLIKEAIKKNFSLIMDVWEGEPSINTNLLEKSKIGTPHIAGYSLEGKINGTKIIYNELCKYFKMRPNWKPALPAIESSELKLPDGKTNEDRLYKLFSNIYNIEEDDFDLRGILSMKLQEQPVYFDMLRKNYRVRREFSNYTINVSDNELHFKTILESFRFKVKVN